MTDFAIVAHLITTFLFAYCLFDPQGFEARYGRVATWVIRAAILVFALLIVWNVQPVTHP